jgi:hypothetical protein
MVFSAMPGLMTVRYSDDAQASRFAAQAYAALVLARQQKAPLGALRERATVIAQPAFLILTRGGNRQLQRGVAARRIAHGFTCRSRG